MIRTLLLFTCLTFAGHQALAASQKFESHDIIIEANEVMIAGRLEVPKNKHTERLVIMLSGSGPQDRDETLDGFKVFKALSEHLTQQGVSNFRFDDRGVDQSTGNFAMSTLKDHSQDVMAVMAYFQQHHEHSYHEFILLGHSQGGIVAGRVAAQSPQVKGVILMAAPGVPLIDLVLYQLRQEHLDQGIEPASVEKLVSAHNRLMRAIHDKKNIDSSVDAVAESTQLVLEMTSENANSNAKKQTEAARAMAEEMEIIYELPSLTSFLYHNAADDYQQLQIPVLSLFGGKDWQVTIAQNKDAIEQALLTSGALYEFVTFNDANHYFQKAITGERDEYEKLDKTFVDGFLPAVSGWIIEQ